MYILGKENQNNILESFQLIAESDGGWAKRYLDPVSDQEWITFLAHPEYHGGGIQLMRKDPPPDNIKTWLKCCFGSDNEDDSNGLGMELSDQYEVWHEVINWIEENSPHIPGDRVVDFIYRLGVLNPRNPRNTIGKSPEEVEKDYQHFINLAERARNLVESS